jgi:hypothetical protein
MAVGRAARNFGLMGLFASIACIAAGVGYATLAEHPKNMAAAVRWCVISTVFSIGLLIGCVTTAKVFWRTLINPPRS